MAAPLYVGHCSIARPSSGLQVFKNFRSLWLCGKKTKTSLRCFLGLLLLLSFILASSCTGFLQISSFEAHGLCRRPSLGVPRCVELRLKLLQLRGAPLVARPDARNRARLGAPGGAGGGKEFNAWVGRLGVRGGGGGKAQRLKKYTHLLLSWLITLVYKKTSAYSNVYLLETWS